MGEVNIRSLVGGRGGVGYFCGFRKVEEGQRGEVNENTEVQKPRKTDNTALLTGSWIVCIWWQEMSFLSDELCV